MSNPYKLPPVIEGQELIPLWPDAHLIDGAESEPSLECQSINTNLKSVIPDLLQHLNPRQTLIVRRIYGIDCEPSTLTAIAEDLSICRERVSQIHLKCLRKFRARMKKMRLNDFIHGHDIEPRSRPSNDLNGYRRIATRQPSKADIERGENLYATHVISKDRKLSDEIDRLGLYRLSPREALNALPEARQKYEDERPAREQAARDAEDKRAQEHEARMRAYTLEMQRRREEDEQKQRDEHQLILTTLQRVATRFPGLNISFKRSGDWFNRASTYGIMAWRPGEREPRAPNVLNSQYHSARLILKSLGQLEIDLAKIENPERSDFPDFSCRAA